MPHGDITHIDIPVTDKARASAFYGALFGWQVIMPKSPISDTSWWAFFEDPDGNVMGLYEGITEVEH
jgi:predicted enzyme related to lactoylglutathione lyase